MHLKMPLFSLIHERLFVGTGCEIDINFSEEFSLSIYCPLVSIMLLRDVPSAYFSFSSDGCFSSPTAHRVSTLS